MSTFDDGSELGWIGSIVETDEVDWEEDTTPGQANEEANGEPCGNLPAEASSSEGAVFPTVSNFGPLLLNLIGFVDQCFSSRS
jgi:hypothetical protein